jgi:hypothetical protein
MALTIFVRKDNKIALACNCTLRLAYFNQPIHDLQNIAIKRFDNLLVAIAGKTVDVDYAFSVADFDKLSKVRLTLGSLCSLFYFPYATRLYDDGNAESLKSKDGSVETYPIKAIFVKDDKAFVFDDDGFSCAPDYFAIGTDDQFANALYKTVYNESSASDIATQALKASIRHLSSVAFPLFLVNPSDKFSTVICQDGSTEKVELPNRLGEIRQVVATDDTFSKRTKCS